MGASSGIAGMSPATIYYTHQQRQSFCGCQVCDQHRRDEMMREVLKKIDALAASVEALRTALATKP